MSEFTDIPLQRPAVKSSITSRAKQAFQLSQREAQLRDMTSLPQGPQTRPVKSSITSRFKQAYQLGKRENVVGKFLQPKVVGVGKKSLAGILAKGAGKIGLGLGLGIVGELTANELRNFRNQEIGIQWDTVDGIIDAVSLGATFINPVLGAVAKPVLNALALTSQETVKNNAVGGGFTMSNDEAAFLKWFTSEIEKDKKAKQKPGAIPIEHIGTAEYQAQKKEKFTNLKGYYDDFEFMDWYSNEIINDRAAAGFGVDDYGTEYEKKKRAEWEAMKKKPTIKEEEKQDEDGGVCEIVYLDPATRQEVPTPQGTSQPTSQPSQPQNPPREREPFAGRDSRGRY